MAKKARKKSAAKGKKVKRATATAKVKTKPKSKIATKNKPARKPRPKARLKGITDKVVSAFHTLVDTIKETDALRNKMERPGTSETS
jgi:hypothetical protein